MERIDNSRFLLFIEPKKIYKNNEPINDEFTSIMHLALSEATIGVSNYFNINEKEFFKFGLNEDNQPIHYFGIHKTDCGEFSTSNDYLLKNGMITNSLCVYYLQYYRNYIPSTEINKVKKLIEFYKIKK